MMRYEMKREMSEGWEWEDWYGANVHQLRITMMLGIIVSLTLSNYRKPNSYALSHKSKTQRGSRRLHAGFCAVLCMGFN